MLGCINDQLDQKPLHLTETILLSVYTGLKVLILCHLVKQAPPQASSGCQARALVQHGLREHPGISPQATGPLKCFQHQATS